MNQNGIYRKRERENQLIRSNIKKTPMITQRFKNAHKN